MNQPASDPTLGSESLDLPGLAGATDTALPLGTLDPAQPAMFDVPLLLDHVLRSSDAQTSALGRARALLLGSELAEHLGKRDLAGQLARDAAEVAPKLSLAASQSRRLGNTDAESVLRQLEATVRMGEGEAARGHAALLLARREMRRGERARAASVLDHLVRTNKRSDGAPVVIDARIEIERLVERLASGESLVGLSLASELQAEAEAVQELLGGARAPRPSPHLALVRASRELGAGRLPEALTGLLQAGVFQADVNALEAARSALKRDGAKASKQLLAELLRQAPERWMWRALALLAVQTADQELLGRVLSDSDPASGTFSAAEGLLLAALTGQTPQLSDDEWQSLFGQSPLFSLALAPRERSPRSGPASLDELIQRLAAILGRPTNEERHHALAALLGELDALGVERPLSALWAWQLAHDEKHSAAGEQRSAAQARAWARLAEWEGPELSFLAALCWELAADGAEAAASYRDFLAFVTSSDGAGSDKASSDGAGSDKATGSAGDSSSWTGPASAAARALTSFGDAESERSEDAVLATAHLAEQLFRRFEAGELPSALFERPSPGAELATKLLESLLSGHAEKPAPWSTRPVASSSETDPLLPLDVVLGVRDALVDLSVDPEGGRLLLRALQQGRPGDVGLGALLRALDPTAPPGDQVPTESPWLAALDAARSVLDRSPADGARAIETAALGRRSEAVLGLDLHLLELAGDTEALSRKWLDLATSAKTEADRRFAYGRLAEIDARRGRIETALLWQRSILEKWPRDLPASFLEEELLLRNGDQGALIRAEERLLDVLPEEEAVGYRLALGAEALGRLDLRSAKRYLGPLAEGEAPQLLALRVLSASATDPPDDAAIERVMDQLLAFASSDLDQLACLERAATAAARQGDRAAAKQRVARMRELRPQAFSTELLALHLEDDDPVSRAEAVERLAKASSAKVHTSELHYAAGVAWQDAGDQPRAVTCFEQSLALDPKAERAFEQLHRIYRTAHDLDKLCPLLESWLSVEPDGPRKRDLELELGHAYIELGAGEKAKTLLEGTLRRHPKEALVLRTHAELAAALGDHRAAETSLSSLAESLPSGSERTSVLASLGRLYERHLGALEKAMDAYQAAFSADPSDLELGKTLVSVQARLGLAERATQLLTEIIQKSPSTDDKRQLALQLAELYEEVAHDVARASATLERTRRAWPLDAAVLDATVAFLQRQGDTSQVRPLVEQTGLEARRKLWEGKIDPGLLATLAKVAELSELPFSAEAIWATRAAYLGETASFPAAGPHALGPELDDVLAPPVLVKPLRVLLQKTSAALDAAFPIDVSALDARPLSEGPIPSRLAEICRGLGQPVPDLFVSAALGSRAVPLSTRPLRLIVGADLALLPNDSIDYLLARAVKLQQLGAGALARSRPEDAWPMIVALVSIFAPNYRPQSLDPQKILKAKALVEQGLARVGYDADVPQLVLETIGALGRQTEGLAEAPRLLVNRAAMLLAGGPGPALVAMSYGDKKPLPDSGPSRYRWIDSHVEARDLLLFCTTAECNEALSRLHGVERRRALPRR